MQKCLTAYTFLCRAYYYDDEVLAQVEQLVTLDSLHRTFYRTYQKQFCLKKNKVGTHSYPLATCRLLDLSRFSGGAPQLPPVLAPEGCKAIDRPADGQLYGAV